MIRLLILTVILGYTSRAYCAERLCDMMDFIECPDAFSGNRSSGSSVPGQGTTLSSSPASIANIDKTGFEIIRYEKSYDLNFIAGVEARTVDSSISASS